MDFISGVIFVGIAFVLAALFFFGIAVRLESLPQQNKRPARQCALLRRAKRFNDVGLTEV